MFTLLAKQVTVVFQRNGTIKVFLFFVKLFNWSLNYLENFKQVPKVLFLDP